MIHVLYWIKASKALPKIAFDSKKLKSIININSKNNANAKEFNSKNTEKVGYNNELFLTFQNFFLKIYLEKEMQGNYTKAT